MLAHLLLAATSIASPTAPPEIIGGVPTQPGEFDTVVAIYASGGICSGTLVAPGIVLTAAHCIDGDLLANVSVAAGPQVNPFNTAPAVAIGVHPDYCRTCSPSDDDIFDYGYVAIPEGALGIDEFAEPIVDQDEWDAAVGKGGTITVVGYGRDEDGVTEIKRKVVTWITDQTASGQEFRAGGDFRDSCGGDSGGPAFVRALDGRWLQAGIVSRGPDPCGSGGVYATPYPALAWLQQQTNAQLCGAECGECDCLDTTAPSDANGCGCSAPSQREIAWAWLPLLLLALRRRSNAGPM